MEEVERKALRAAVDNQRKGQSFEESLAINVKRAGLGYDTYIELIGKVRKASKKRTMAEAALILLSDE
jgi:hypothetical protein